MKDPESFSSNQETLGELPSPTEDEDTIDFESHLLAQKIETDSIFIESALADPRLHYPSLVGDPEAEAMFDSYQDKAFNLRQKITNVLTAFAIGAVPNYAESHDERGPVNQPLEVVLTTNYSNPEVDRPSTIITASQEKTVSDSVETKIEPGPSTDSSQEETVIAAEVKPTEAEIIQRRIESGFTNEDELLEFYRDLANTSAIEHSILYAKDDFGSVRILNITNYGANGNLVLIRPAEIEADQYRADGNTRLKFLHTHPQKTIQEILPEDKKAASGTLPPSPHDLVTALKTGYNNRFSSYTLKEETPGKYTYENIVVDGLGTWQYSIGEDSGFIDQMQSEQIENLMQSDGVTRFLRENPQITADELKATIKSLNSPDTLVNERSIETLNDRGLNMNDFNDLLLQYKFGAFAAEKGLASEYTEKQIQVANGIISPDEFISYCRQHGINMTFTPFNKPGVTQ